MFSVIMLICYWYHYLLKVWSSIWSVATTRIDFWTWIWSARHCGLGQQVACWFQCWKNIWFRLTGLVTLVLLLWTLMGYLLEEKSFKMLGLLLLFWIGLGLIHYLYCSNCLQENWNLDSSYKVFLLMLLCISINLPYGHESNTVVMSGNKTSILKANLFLFK